MVVFLLTTLRAMNLHCILLSKSCLEEKRLFPSMEQVEAVVNLGLFFQDNVLDMMNTLKL